MKTWDQDASEYFENWLGRVRSSVAGDPKVNADDIAQDLRAHVHAELETAPDPVTRSAVERVVNTLGNPAQWDAPPPARPAVRFYTGASDAAADWQRKLATDWGKPVLLALLTAVGIVTVGEGLGVALLAVAYFMARGQLAYGTEPLTGRTRWLVYFPLAVGAGLLTGFVLGFPLTFEGAGHSHPFELLWMLGSWWAVVGFVAAREPRRVRSALHPFAGTFESGHGRMLSLIGIAFLIAASVVLLAR